MKVGSGIHHQPHNESYSCLHLTNGDAFSSSLVALQFVCRPEPRPSQAAKRGGGRGLRHAKAVYMDAKVAWT